MSSPLPTDSIPDTFPSNHVHPSRTSIALIVASLFSFAVLVYIAIHKRPSRGALLTPSPPKGIKPPPTRKPKLWEISLDGDHPRLDGAVPNWQPIAAWAGNRLGRLPRPRQASAPRALPEPVHVSMAHSWFHGSYPLNPRRPTPPASAPISDPRTLNVAVLVAMPSRRLEVAQSIHGTAPHRPIESRLSYGEGQLSIGTTTLVCDGQALLTSLTENELERTR